MDTINPRRFGLASGLTWGLGMLLLGLLAAYLDWGSAAVSVLGSVYQGYEATLVGSVIGGVWGLVDGFIGGWVLAWLYNKVK